MPHENFGALVETTCEYLDGGLMKILLTDPSNDVKKHLPGHHM